VGDWASSEIREHCVREARTVPHEIVSCLGTFFGTRTCTCITSIGGALRLLDATADVPIKASEAAASSAAITGARRSIDPDSTVDNNELPQLSSLRMRRLCVVAVFLCLILAAPGTALADAPWQWTAGHTWWGYNHVTFSTNSYVNGPTNYWYDYTLDKLNGGTSTHVFYSHSADYWCQWNVSGSNTGSYAVASALGCGGYNHPVVGWWSGNSSYLRADVRT
jgi:hypothetical protein